MFKNNSKLTWDLQIERKIYQGILLKYSFLFKDQPPASLASELRMIRKK